MNDARILDLCDAVANVLRSTWSPTSPSNAAREYGPDVGTSEDDGSAALLVGRQVFVYPAAYGAPTLEIRDAFDRRYMLQTVTLERYTGDDGVPPKAWMDERVNFDARMFKLFRDPTQPTFPLLDTIMPDLENPATVDVVYDFELFQEQRLFKSQHTYPFQEIGPL